MARRRGATILAKGMDREPGRSAPSHVVKASGSLASEKSTWWFSSDMEAQYTMSNAVEIAIRNRGDIAVIDIKGDVTAFTGEPIEDAYEQVSTDGLQKILCVFDKKCSINSGGIAILISIVGESPEREQTICFAGVSEHFQKIFDMVGLTRYIKIFPSEEAALEGF